MNEYRSAIWHGWSVAGGALLFAAFWIVSTPAATAETTPSHTIAVQGNHRIDADTVRSYFHSAPDGSFDTGALDAALKALLATGLFNDVVIDRPDGRIAVYVTEAPILNSVAFEGNKKVKDTELAAVVESKPRDGLQRAKVQADVGRIIEAYKHIGRDNVHVVPQIINRGDDRVDLVYVVTEGNKTTVRRINFVGNRIFGERQLRAIIKTSASHVLSFLTGGDVYDPDRIEQDREQLRLYYRSKGYADAKVASATAEYDAAAEGFILSFSIDEGPLYNFGDIKIASNVPGLSPEQLRHLLVVRTGAVFDGSALDKTVDVLAIEMAKLGHPFAQATAHITRDPAARQIGVSLVVDQGSPAYVERIEIHGNARTRDYVIRREFDIAEGDPYNKTLIDRAEQRLKNLNYFKTIKISKKPGSVPDRVVLDVEVIDKSTGETRFAGGYSTADGFLVEATLGENNLMGTGRSIKGSVTYGQYARALSLRASEPYFLGTRVAAGIELFGRQTEASSYQSYGSDVYGATIQFGTPLTEQVGLQWRYSLSNQNVTLDPATTARASLPIQQAALAGQTWVSAVGETVTYSTLNNTNNPTSGINSQLKQDLAGLGGDVNFLRTTEDLRYYHAFSSDLVGLIRGQGGYIGGWGGKQVPLINSFFGGPSLVRGFAPNGFGPRDLTPGTTMDNVGGSMYWASTAELQSSIPGIPQEYGLKATAFVDAGSVFHYGGPTTFPGSAQSLKIGDANIARSSVGAGLTWASPFGALTVDYAVPLTKAAYDVKQSLRFGAGPF